MHHKHKSSKDRSPSPGEEMQAGPDAARAQRGRAPGGAAASRLDKRTYFDREEGRWSIRARDYGDGLCEVGWSFVGSILIRKASRGEAEERDVHELRAVRRARSRLRQLVLSANADHLLTLTYHANVTDFKQASADLARFVRRVRAKLPFWVYIAVPERQTRGAWHWHLAVVGRQDVDLLRAAWRAVVGDGNIDVQQSKSRSTNRRLALVRYLGKYLAKAFEENDRELNGHRFRASQGIVVPCRSIELPPDRRKDVSGFAQEQLGALAGSVGYVWTDDSGLMGWASSWE